MKQCERENGLVRPVELLVGSREMAEFLKISTSKVRGLEKSGAPIVRDGSGTMRAEKAELWNWWKLSRGGSSSSSSRARAGGPQGGS